jgi:two-component system, OmpR family, torCAD operon response regulator TorR
MNSSPKVLIIEDYKLIAESLRDNILELNICSEVHIAETAVTARDYIKHSQPQIILLDLNLPDENGMILLKELKSNTSVLGVIIVTNDSSEKLRHYCKCLGASYYVDKGTEFENITTYIKSLVDQWKIKLTDKSKHDSTAKTNLRPVNFANL